MVSFSLIPFQKSVEYRVGFEPSESGGTIRFDPFFSADASLSAALFYIFLISFAFCSSYSCWVINPLSSITLRRCSLSTPWEDLVGVSGGGGGGGGDANNPGVVVICLFFRFW